MFLLKPDNGELSFFSLILSC